MNIIVTVKPNSKRPGIEQISENGYIVRVSAPAHEGKANRAVIKALARFLDIAPSRISVVHGTSSKNKVVEIT